MKLAWVSLVFVAFTDFYVRSSPAARSTTPASSDARPTTGTLRL
jgi:hypothetical protein